VEQHYHGHDSSEQARLSSDMLKDFRPEQQRADRVVAAVKQVSDQVGRSMAQVALACLRYRTVPVIPIIGARSSLNCRTISPASTWPFARSRQDSR